MAKRHLYSRVPAKASMYQLTDGYDTFARSGGLDKDFIFSEMGRLFEYSPGKAESGMILDGVLPPTYASLRTPGGDIVHSCITYLPRDFTGERYAVMINSLVLDKDEKQEVYTKKEAAYFNPGLFDEKISDFKITSADYAPITDYPETRYETAPLKDISQIVGEYDERVIKRLLFALIYVTSYKNKYVFIAPVMPAEELSQWGLELINALMQLFPAFVRERLSYITFITEYKKMNCFNVKFVHSDDIQTAGKGFIFDMTPSKADNIKDSEYKECESEINFLYELCENKTKRDAWTSFCDNISLNDDNYEKPSLNAFCDLVLLFKQARYEGEPEENDLVANDNACFKLISTYQSHRNVLELKDRLNILAPLISRYCRTRAAIPANIFSRITKLYPKEPEECRVVIMDGLLELIHTDAMREKLFSFIKSVFDGENAERREIICENLSRVFYGGFLQEQILTLFDTAFEKETYQSKTNIISKLLLSIRTEGIRDKVFEFLKAHRDHMTEDHRNLVYSALVDAIPFKDKTASMAVEVIDHYTQIESPAAQNEIVYELYAMLEEDDSVAGVLVTDSDISRKGPVSLGIIKKIVRNNAKKKLFTLMLSRLAGQKLYGIANAVEGVWLFDETDSEGINKALSDKLRILFEEAGQNTTLEDMITLHKRLTESPLNKGDFRQGVYKKLCLSFLYPLMGERYIKALDPRQYAKPISYYAGFALTTEGISSFAGVKTVIQFADLVKAINDLKPVDALDIVFKLEIPPELVQLALYRLKAECKGVFELSANSNSAQVVDVCSSGCYAVATAAAEYIEHKRINMPRLFDENLKVLEKRLQDDLNKAEDPPKNFKKASLEAHDTALVKSLEGLTRFCANVCKTRLDEMAKQKLCYAHISDLDYILVDLFNSHFKSLKKEVMGLSHHLRATDAIIAEKVKNNYGKKSLPERDDTATPTSSATTASQKSKGFSLFKRNK